MTSPAAEDLGTVAAEARVYRDKQGGLWLDPFGDGNLFPFDRQCRALMTEKWGTVPMDVIAAQFELAELAPAVERGEDWAVQFRVQDHHRWILHEYKEKAAAVSQRDRMREAGMSAVLKCRQGAVGPGEWQDAEDRA